MCVIIFQALYFTDKQLKKVDNFFEIFIYPSTKPCLNRTQFFFISTRIACRLYSNLTSRWHSGFGTRVTDGSLAEAGEFPWMVLYSKLNNITTWWLRSKFIATCKLFWISFDYKRLHWVTWTANIEWVSRAVARLSRIFLYYQQRIVWKIVVDQLWHD